LKRFYDAPINAIIQPVATFTNTTTATATATATTMSSRGFVPHIGYLQAQKKKKIRGKIA